MQLFGITHSVLDQAIAAAGLRQQLIANNIANVNTPGYKRHDINFEAALSQALDNVDDSAEGTEKIDALAHTIQVDSSTSMRTDGNNVDVDVEMSNLAENNVRYNALVQVAAKQMQMLEHVISDGRR